AESLLLATAGGALGLLAAAWLTPRLGLAIAARAPEPIALDFAADGRVVAFAAALCVLTAVAFGLVPALQASRPALVASLKACAPRRSRRSCRSAGPTCSRACGWRGRGRRRAATRGASRTSTRWGTATSRRWGSPSSAAASSRPPTAPARRAR